MVYFQTKNPNWGKFWRVLQRMMLVYFVDIWYILRPIGMYCGLSVHFIVIYIVYFSPFWYIAPKKSGNPALDLIGCKTRQKTWVAKNRPVEIGPKFYSLTFHISIAAGIALHH
jgi:hypothetical protein